MKVITKLPFNTIQFRVLYTKKNNLMAFYITRNFFDKNRNRIKNKYPQLKTNGVYILYRDYPDFGKNLAYIGKSSNVWKRTCSHTYDTEKQWKIATLFVTNDKEQGFDDGDISYLEPKMIKNADNEKFVYLSYNVQTPKERINHPKNYKYLDKYLKNIDYISQLLGFHIFHNLCISSPQVNYFREKAQEAAEIAFKSTKKMLKLRLIT